MFQTREDDLVGDLLLVQHGIHVLTQGCLVQILVQIRQDVVKGTNDAVRTVA